MKDFIKSVFWIISIMLTMITFVASIILGFRVIQLLWNGWVNPSLCLECVGAFVLFGLFATSVKALSPDNIEYHITDNTIVGKRDDDLDE